MAHTEFVVVHRVDHGDVMAIPISVLKQYPNKFIPVEEEETVEVKPKTRKKQ